MKGIYKSHFWYKVSYSPHLDKQSLWLGIVSVSILAFTYGGFPIIASKPPLSKILENSISQLKGFILLSSSNEVVTSRYFDSIKLFPHLIL